MASRQRITEHAGLQAEQQPRPAHVPHGALQVGDSLPARLVATDMQRIFGIGSSRFYALVKAGRFDAFEILPRIGQRAWSGARVLTYLKGEALPDASRRKFFGKRSW